MINAGKKIAAIGLIVFYAADHGAAVRVEKRVDRDTGCVNIIALDR